MVHRARLEKQQQQHLCGWCTLRAQLASLLGMTGWTGQRFLPECQQTGMGGYYTWQSLIIALEKELCMVGVSVALAQPRPRQGGNTPGLCSTT